MDIVTILVLVVIGVILLKIVGKVFKIIISLGIILLIIYVINETMDAAMIIPLI